LSESRYKIKVVPTGQTSIKMQDWHWTLSFANEGIHPGMITDGYAATKDSAIVKAREAAQRTIERDKRMEEKIKWVEENSYEEYV
jgi:hypothetical protein